MAEELISQPDIPVWSLFTSPQVLLRMQDPAAHPTAQCSGVTVALAGLVPLPPTLPPRATAADGDPRWGTESQTEGWQLPGAGRASSLPSASQEMHGWGSSTGPVGDFCSRHLWEGKPWAP